MSGILSPEQISQERLNTMSRVFAKADRVLSAQRVSCEVIYQPGNSAPAWSNGEKITFNAAHVGSVTSVDDIIKVTGLNYHELSHVLFTPRNGTSLVKAVIADGNFRYFNMLEDQRIETLMVTKYASTKPFFIACFMRYLLANKDQWTRVFPLAHGRKYLPLDARLQMQARFSDQQIVTDLVRVIDEYRVLAFPRDQQRGLDLIREYADLMGKMKQQPQGDPFGHVSSSAVRADATKGVPENHTKTADTAKDDTDKDAQENNDDDSDGNGSGSDDDDSEVDDDASSDSADSDDDHDDSDEDGDDDDSDDMGDGSGDGDDDVDEDLNGDVGGDQKAGSQAGGDADEDSTGGEGESESDSKGTSGSGVGKGNAQQPGEPVDDDAFDDILRNAAEQAEQAPAVQQDARDKQDVIVNGDGDTMSALDPQRFSSCTVPAELLAGARKFGKELSRLRDDIDPGWHREQASGRLNVARAMRGDEIDTVFDRWDEGKNDAADIEAVILLDYSDSMGSMMDGASQAMWAIKRSFEDVGAKVTVIGYSDGATLMYDGTSKVERTTYRRFTADGGTQPNQALDEAMRVLHKSRRHSKYLISITDGAWWSDESPRIERMNRAGVVTGMVFLPQPSHAARFRSGSAAASNINWQGHTVTHISEKPLDLAPFAVGLVKARLKQPVRGS